MKLRLTTAGIENTSIRTARVELPGEPIGAQFDGGRTATGRESRSGLEGTWKQYVP